MCALVEDRSLPPDTRAAAAAHLRDILDEGRVPEQLVPRVQAALSAS